ncbi:MAG: tRNA pseudouridine(38-40) synthase TruA [Betaproteobacteria bacterium]|nr:tRNA pseudouridine(38-40) synthase TruA [Betaproteobacteria bacterium]
MRVAIGISYDGTDFDGWQSQRSGNTVQDRLESALQEIAGMPVRLIGAGRTDSRVHALAQFAHFDCDVARPDSAWVRGTNALLPRQIAVQWAKRVSPEFHARFSARSRSYRYVLYNHAVRPSVLAGKVGWFHRPLDIERMRAAANMMLGEHDFSAFRSSRCQSMSPVRRLVEARICIRGNYFVFCFSANAFLHHMVRNMMGCLVHVGKGSAPPEWVADVLAGRDRKLAAPTFSPDGLYLTEVRYEDIWGLPKPVHMMPFGIDL